MEELEVVRVKNNADIAEEVAKLKAQPGKNLVLWGGVRIAQTFAELGLIDEYWLLIQPKVLGARKALIHGHQGPDQSQSLKRAASSHAGPWRFVTSQ